jgi:hypothetical protein
MPWKEICTVELREALVSAMLAGEVGVADPCRRARCESATRSTPRRRWIDPDRSTRRAATPLRARFACPPLRRRPTRADRHQLKVLPM